MAGERAPTGEQETEHALEISRVGRDLRLDQIEWKYLTEHAPSSEKNM